MQTAVGEQVLKIIPNISLQSANVSGEIQNITKGAKEISTSGNQPTHSSPLNKDFKNEIGRNDLCLCGSGKKYKRCGILNTEEHQKLMSKKIIN
jgi:uncharacterized protein YecA (UPF0149 family)